MFKRVHVFRVKPEQELATEIASYYRQNNISLGVVIGELGYQLRRYNDEYTGLNELQ